MEKDIFNNIQEFYKYRKLLTDPVEYKTYKEYYDKQTYFMQKTEKDKDNLCGNSLVILTNNNNVSVTSNFDNLLQIISGKKKKDYQTSDFNYDSIIFIADIEPSKNILKSCESKIWNLCDRKPIIELLHLGLFYNIIPKGIYCSPHYIINKEEEENLLTFLKCDKSCLPVILSSDPYCIWIGGRKGQIIKIERNSENTGENIYYRTVV